MGSFKEVPIGTKSGRLTVVEDLGIFLKDGTKKKRHYVKCDCDCGNKGIIIDASQFDRGKIKSCGCIRKENVYKALKKYNEYYVWEDIVFVKYTNCNEYFICDLEDWERLKQYAWYKAYGYAVATPKRGEKAIRFHRVITDCPEGMVPDHLYPVSNGVCDNRKSNLEIKTSRENTLNTGMYSHNTSGYRGVHFDNSMNKYRAIIYVENKKISLGWFDDIEDAARAYDEAADKYFGDFRRKNIELRIGGKQYD